MTRMQTPPAVFADSTGHYRATILRGPSARLQGQYNQADDMYHRGGEGRSEWIQLTGAVLIEQFNDSGEPTNQDVLLASEFNTRFGMSLPVD